MPKSYCSCACAGQTVRLAPDLFRPGMYVCTGCGASEEVVKLTIESLNRDWVDRGIGAGHIPDDLLAQATIIDEDGSDKLLPFKEPWVEGKTDSGRSLAELVTKHKEIAADKGVEV